MKLLRIVIFAITLIVCFTACGQHSKQVDSMLSPAQETASAYPTASHDPTKVPETEDAPSAIGMYVKDKEEGVRRRVEGDFVSVWQEQQDIQCFEVFLTSDSTVPMGTYSQVWNKYAGQYENVKVGYFLDVFYTDNTQQTIRILSPEDTKAIWDCLEIYIYDDVNQTPGQWYSHLEDEDFTEETICSSIKLTPGAMIGEISSMKLTAFTYSDMGYFTQEGEFLGNNSCIIEVLNMAR